MNVVRDERGGCESRPRVTRQHANLLPSYHDMVLNGSLFRLVIDVFSSFRNVLIASVALRIALIVYSEWHDAHSAVKYTDIDYRVFSDAAHFILHPSAGNVAQGPLGQWLGIGE